MRNNPPPGLHRAHWSMSREDTDGPIVGYRYYDWCRKCDEQEDAFGEIEFSIDAATEFPSEVVCPNCGQSQPFVRNKARPIRLKHGPRAVSGGVLEPLYHTTAFLSEILETDTILPAGGGARSILGGGGGRTEAVSMNNTLHGSAHLAICIAEAVMIAKGQVTLQQVKDRAVRLGIPGDRFLHYWLVYVPSEVYTYHRKELLTKILGSDVDNAILSAALDGKYYAVSGLWLDEPRLELKSIDNELMLSVVFNAYRALLHAGAEQRLIPDPGFFSDSPHRFMGLTVTNVGVVQCALPGAQWVARGYYRDDAGNPIPGAFTYIGHDREEYLPDSDEYKVYDYQSLEIVNYYNIADCLEYQSEYTSWGPRYKEFSDTSFLH